MERREGARRASRRQRCARRAHTVRPARDTRNILADEADEGRVEQAIGILLIVLALALFAAIGGDGTDVAEHDAWMQQVKEQGAWVMW